MYKRNNWNRKKYSKSRNIKTNRLPDSKDFSAIFLLGTIHRWDKNYFGSHLKYSINDIY